MPTRHSRLILCVLFLTMVAFLCLRGTLARPYGPLQFLPGMAGPGFNQSDVGLVLDVLQLVDKGYVRELTATEKRKFIENSIQGGLSSLDPHSQFMPPTEQNQFRKQNDGKFAGIGVNVVVQRDTRRVTVITPVFGSPAWKAGIRPGDEIEEIDDKPVIGIEPDEVTDRIAGQPGTPVKLAIRRRGSPRKIEMVLNRAIIEMENLTGDRRDANNAWDFLLDKETGIAYMRLGIFNRKTAEEVATVLNNIPAGKLHGLVLDLRNNPGGDLRASVELADLFLNEGEIVRVLRRGETPEVFTAKPAGTLMEPAAQFPIAVLINSNSASASEILAAALQDHKRATILGERSYGKGSVQHVYELEGRTSALRLTSGKYIRPNGKNIHRFPESKPTDDWGVTPDILLNLTPQEEIENRIYRIDRDILRDESALFAEQQNRLATLVGALAMQPASCVAGASVGSMVELETQMAQLPVRPKAVPDRVLDKAVEVLRDKMRK